MARIAETEIERLKNEISVQRLVEASGIALKKTGKDFTGCCPFHEDDTASLVVTPAKNLWHCFGCGIGGGPIDWVIKKNGVSFRHAVELLREGLSTALKTGSSLAAGSGAVKRSSVRALPPPVSRDADDQLLLNQVTGYYHDTLQHTPEALAYLQARGIDHPEVVAHFKLGFADRSLGLRLPDKRRKEGELIRTRLENAGLYRASGHEHFNGSLVIPVLDEASNVTEIYGRKIRDDLRKGTPAHLYLPGAHAGVWNIEALHTSKEIILCEALLDALTFWCAGYRNVTASYGVEGFTSDHLAAFKKYHIERILIAYDRDAAGDVASDKLAAQLLGEGIECYRIQFPKGMDANEYALKVTPASKSLGVAIRKALWMGKGTAPQAAPSTLPEPALQAPVDAPSEPVAAAVTDSSPSTELRTGLAAAVAIDPLPASPMPSAPAPDVTAEVTGNEVVMSIGSRRYRMRGLQKNLTYEVLKVNVLAAHGEAFHVDTFDLYTSRARASFITQAAIELRVAEDIIKADIGRVLLKLETLQDEQIRQTLAPKEPQAITLSEAERSAALDLLKSPDLLQRILHDFEACGVVGESTNKLVGYLAATSRLLAAPLAVVIQSSSAAGKSALMDAVLALMPEEQRIKYSAMTGQSLFYMGETNLKHKILAIVEEEGASRASYALKLLQSEGELTIASTGKDPVSGNLTTQEYRVEGPVMLFLTTTAIEIDEELMNRCLVLSVDEGREQTAAIHQLQRQKRTLAGLLAKQEKDLLIQLHRNAQRLLRPLAVVNPYAGQLTFLSDKTRTRRDHEKYLTLIDTLALLHQYQRPVKTTRHRGAALDYIEVTLSDIEQANALAHEVLGRSLDELPPQTRRLLMLVDAMVKQQCAAQNIARGDYRFSRKDIRTATGWGDTQLKIHLARLAELEYLLTHRILRGQGYVYELLYDGTGEASPHLSGLIDPAALQKYSYDAERSGLNAVRSAPGRGLVGGQSATGRVDEPAQEPHGMDVAAESQIKPAKMHLLQTNSKVMSRSTGSGQAPPQNSVAPR
jgi:DNA primase